MEKETRNPKFRKRALLIFCAKFLKNKVTGDFLSIADLEVKAICGIEKYKQSEPTGIDTYICEYPLSAQTLNALYLAGYYEMVQDSYFYHGKGYNTEFHESLNRKLGIQS